MRYLLSLWLLFSLPVFADSVVITNVSTGMKDKLTVKEAREIFLLQKTYSPAGVPYKLYLLPEDSIGMREFISKTLQLSPSSYFDTINSYKAVGKLREPIPTVSSTRMIILVGITNGGIGFTLSPELTYSLKTIKTVEVVE